MSCLFPTVLRRCPTLAGLLLAALLTGGTAAAAVPKELTGSGVATVPADAAFFSSALRLQEQYDRFIG
nr:hypothetical protein [Pirellulales bacterium]